MNRLQALMAKEEKLVIGLMSGTSADGIDAVLARIRGNGPGTEVSQLAFLSEPFPPEVRERILLVAGGEFGGARELCLLGALLGSLYADACLALCEKAGISPGRIDLVGTHGQTVFHIPVGEEYLGRSVRGTLQIGEPSPIAEALGCVVASDFRVRDMAAGGQGAPLVPYTEFLLYRHPTEHVALQNIGGIGNITVLPAGCALEEVTAFDTGPGNMLIDSVVGILTEGRLTYDRDGLLALGGRPHEGLLSFLMDDPYLSLSPPKTTGREYYNRDYVENILSRARGYGLSDRDIAATVTRYTAETVRVGIERFCPVVPARLVVGGGGSHNPALMGFLARALPDTEVVTNEDIGFDSDAKEALAFAVLANEALHCITNNAPSATGASHPVVMGKLSQ